MVILSNLQIKAQKIVDSYKGCPSDPIVKESLINEIANLVVDDIIEKKQDIRDFDFQKFLDPIANLPE
jgi:hypothetical protein